MNRPADPGVAIAPDDLAWARAESARGERKLIELLEERLACGPTAFVSRLALTLQLPAVALDDMRAQAPAFDVVPYAEASRRACIALRGDDGTLSVVLGDPYDSDTHDWLEERIEVPFGYSIAHRLDILAYLSQQEAELRALDGVASGIGDRGASREDAEDISFETISETDSTVVRLVNSTLYDALKAGASDIHLESTPSGLTIKNRIDGVLTLAESVPGVELAEQVISRIKVMSALDIAERRVPQDGRFKARRNGREIDFRVSVMPSVHGEDAVLRILDKQSLSDQLHGLTLDQLGFEARFVQRLRRLYSEPYGMMLVTGPTGSGKTTTLYAVMTEANTGLDKIITIEDPVEYQLTGVLQIPVNEQKGLTFARGLRSILRHDPDRIMVGEIRDPETAEIAVQSALTGHLVYTTVHANNAFDVLGRFTHMGVDLYNFASALNCVLAQRLVRVICRECAVDDPPDAALLRESGLGQIKVADYRFRHGRGCAHCRGTGYRGRKAIGELLVMNNDLRERIVAREPVRRLKEAAGLAGALTLREAALELVRAGETTLEEINTGRPAVTAVISNEFVRYALLPWSAAIRREAEWLAYARHRYGTIHGPAAEGWFIRIAPAAQGLPRLAAAVDRTLLGALREAVHPHGPLVSVQPYLMAAYNRVQAALKHAGSWLVFEEPERLTLALVDRGVWRAVRTRRKEAHWRAALPRLLDRESALLGLEAPCTEVTVCADAAFEEEAYGPYRLRGLALAGDGQAALAVAMG